MAGISLPQLVERVLYELSRTGIGGVKKDTIEVLVPKATNQLADAIVDDDGRRALLSKDYAALPLSSGVADLSSSSDLLLRSLKYARVRHSSSTYRLEPVPDAAYLEMPLSDQYVFYAIEGRKLRFYSAAGSLVGTIDIFGAVAVPSISFDGTTTTLPPELEDDLVTILVSMFTPPPSPNTPSGAAPA